MPSHAADSLHEAVRFPSVCIARWFEVRGVVHAIAFLWLMRPISEASSSMFGSCAPRAKREKLSHLSESERCESFPRFVQVQMRPSRRVHAAY